MRIVETLSPYPRCPFTKIQVQMLRERFRIEACGRQLWLAMNPRSGPSAHAEGYT